MDQQYQHHRMTNGEITEFSTPWARQWYEDLRALTQITDSQHMYEAAESNYISLFTDPGVVTDFVLLDPTVLRAVSKKEVEGVIPVDDSSVPSGLGFACHFHKDDGAHCLASFS